MLDKMAKWYDGKSPGEIFLYAVIVIGGLFVLEVFVVKWLWNWLIPVIFGLPTIGFYQSLGLLLLCGLLFGSHKALIK